MCILVPHITSYGQVDYKISEQKIYERGDQRPLKKRGDSEKPNE